MNMKMSSNGQNGKNQGGLFINGHAGSNLQTINGQSQQINNSLLLPHAPGASSSMSGAKSTWNTQNLGHTLTQTNQKNKDRYMQMQQQTRPSDQS